MTRETIDERRGARRQLITQLLRMTGEEDIHGSLVNLSHGGFMLLSRNPIRENQLAHLRLELPREVDGAKSVYLDARCVWCQKSSYSNDYGAGFRIENISAGDKRRIEAVFGGL